MGLVGRGVVGRRGCASGRGCNVSFVTVGDDRGLRYVVG